MTKSLSIKVTTDSTAWSFVSGKIAALESELLPRSFFETILKASERGEARGALGKSGYRTLFPDDRSLDSVSSILEQRAREARSEIFKLCPPHPLENYLGIWSRFRTFRTLFNQACKHANPGPEEMEELFTVFAVEPAYAEGLREHRAMLHRKNPPQQATPMERSLYLDSAACSLMRVVSEFVPDGLVREYMSDRAVLTAWSGVFRLIWAGVPADIIRNWYVFDGGRDLAASIVASEHDPKAEIGSRLSARSSAILDGLDPQRIRADIDSAASDVLRETVLACRMVTAGPERVLSYLVANEVELVNLELCLSAVANGIDRDVTLSRLRREYA